MAGMLGDAIEKAKPLIRELCEAQQRLVDLAGVRDAGEFKLFVDYAPAVFDAVSAAGAKDVEAVYRDASLGKELRDEKLSEVRSAVVDRVLADGVDGVDESVLSGQAREAFRSLEKKVVRRLIVT